MTMQEIFNTVCAALIAQGEKSYEFTDLDTTLCMYRKTKVDGTVLKCAGGWLIPDEDYEEEMEGRTVGSLGYFGDRYDADTRSFIGTLQACHDNSFADAFVVGFIERVRVVGKGRGLDVSVLDRA